MSVVNHPFFGGAPAEWLQTVHTMFSIQSVAGFLTLYLYFTGMSYSVCRAEIVHVKTGLFLELSLVNKIYMLYNLPSMLQLLRNENVHFYTVLMSSTFDNNL